MGILKRILGDTETANTLVKGAVDGLDKAFFTAEERSEAGAKMAEWYLQYLAATNPQNLARRVIALFVVGLWCALIVFSVAVYRLDEGWSLYAFDTMTEVVANPFMIVIGFYFAAHVVRAWQGGKPK